MAKKQMTYLYSFHLKKKHEKANRNFNALFYYYQYFFWADKNNYHL